MIDDDDYDDYDGDAEQDDDKEYRDACEHINQLEERAASNEGGDDDDWDEEDPHGSRPIDDPANLDEDEDEDDDTV